jgi:hypothetical protein
MLSFTNNNVDMIQGEAIIFDELKVVNAGNSNFTVFYWDGTKEVQDFEGTSEEVANYLNTYFF